MSVKYLKVKTRFGAFTVSSGNSKVKFPILNVGSAMDCASRKWCPFDLENHKQAGRKICYAQGTERLRPNVLKSRRMNEFIIRSLDPDFLSKIVANAIIGKMETWNFNTIRINESGDLADWNIEFLEQLISILRFHGIIVYLYSKAPLKLRQRAINAGATVLHSERDFVAYGSQTELESSDAFPCKGICGPCRACPDFNGKKIGILEH